jgi:hypothetical protein
MAIQRLKDGDSAFVIHRGLDADDRGHGSAYSVNSVVRCAAGSDTPAFKR